MQAKKSLGQNFLADATVLAHIIEVAQIRSTDIIIEIGAGKGALTRVLAKKSNRVIALELDDDLIPRLLRDFPITSNVKIVHQDFLKTNILELMGGQHSHQKKPYRVIANIPYYITAPIIKHILDCTTKPQDILLMVQKEVAERITASPGDMSILAISVQIYADIEYCFTVPRTAFFPIPKVDSAIIRITPRENLPLKEKLFFRIVRTGFSSKRKTLVNNLFSGLHIPKEILTAMLGQLGLDPNCRAQMLSIEQ